MRGLTFNKNKQHNKSINFQFAISFIAVMASILVVCYLANNLLLKRYYVHEKVNVLKTAFDSLNDADQNDTLDEETFERELRGICERYNLDLLIMDPDSQTIKFEGGTQMLLMMMLWDHIISDSEMQKPPGGIRMETDTIYKDNRYEIGTTTDPRMNSEYLDMWGTLDSGNLFIVRTAVDGIDDSVGIANTFLGYVGIIAILISVIIILYVSKRVTKPILELADISDKMAGLDFEARYTPVGDNEITLLGNNINKLSESLEATISELKSANLKLQKDIENKEKIDEMRKEFLSNVSHELKTPIAIIQGYAEGLKDGIADDPESMDYYVDVINDEAAKMNAMVQKLLTLNQIEFGNDKVEMDRFDIVSLIKTQVATSEPLTRSNGITISIPDSEPVYVWGDSFKVDEIFRNYLTNAIHYCKYDKNIDVRLEEHDEKVRVTVFNTGDQIPEESIDRVWEKFYKVDKARTREYGGSGIGLSIVAALCKSMNMTYGVNNYDNGVAFWFELDRQ